MVIFSSLQCNKKQKTMKDAQTKAQNQGDRQSTNLIELRKPCSHEA